MGGQLPIVVVSGLNGNIDNLEMLVEGLKNFRYDKVYYLGETGNKHQSYDESKLNKLFENIRSKCITSEESVNDLDSMFTNSFNPDVIEKEQTPDSKYLFFPSERPEVYVLNGSGVQQMRISMQARLNKADAKYFITPGAIGRGPGQSNLTVFHPDDGLLQEYTLLDLVDLSRRRDLLLNFENWMPNLVGDINSWSSLEPQIKELEKVNKYGDFNNVILVMQKFNPPRQSSRGFIGYYQDFTRILAKAVSYFATDRVMQHYKVRQPQDVRQHVFELLKPGDNHHYRP
ncbi:MAG: hypothetical protein U9R08_05775, partial [Nanoarchaeota archaeon]|nr:hypothetical protein [Nanoarchaeota archaeon]